MRGFAHAYSLVVTPHDRIAGNLEIGERKIDGIPIAVGADIREGVSRNERTRLRVVDIQRVGKRVPELGIDDARHASFRVHEVVVPRFGKYAVIDERAAVTMECHHAGYENAVHDGSRPAFGMHERQNAWLLGTDSGNGSPWLARIQAADGYRSECRALGVQSAMRDKRDVAIKPERGPGSDGKRDARGNDDIGKKNVRPGNA